MKAQETVAPVQHQARSVRGHPYNVESPKLITLQPLHHLPAVSSFRTRAYANYPKVGCSNTNLKLYCSCFRLAFIDSSFGKHLREADSYSSSY